MILLLNILLQESLENDLLKLMKAPSFGHSTWSGSVLDIDSRQPLFDLAEDQLMVGGSVTKLFSCAGVLSALGADYRFSTDVLTNGLIGEDGTLVGDLILETSDPTLGSRIDPSGQLIVDEKDHTYGRYGGSPFSGDPGYGLGLLAEQIAAKGVRRIKGTLLFGGRGALVSTPSWNEGVLDVTVRALGDKALVEIVGKPRFLKVVSEVNLTESGDTTIQLSLEDEKLLVKGTLNRETPYFDAFPIPTPESFAVKVFNEKLEDRGIPVEGQGIKASTPVRLAHLDSPTVAELSRIVLKSSNNKMANQLLIQAALSRGRKGLGEAANWMGEQIQELGLDANGLAISDGAGTDPADRISAAQLTRLLAVADRRPWGKALRDALPVLGVDGTLKDTLPKAESVGQVSAKTGTLLAYDSLNRRLFLTTKSIAGYVRTRSGRRLAFAFIVNNVPLKYYEEVPVYSDRLAELADLLYRKG